MPLFIWPLRQRQRQPDRQRQTDRKRERQRGREREREIKGGGGGREEPDKICSSVYLSLVTNFAFEFFLALQ